VDVRAGRRSRPATWVRRVKVVNNENNGDTSWLESAAAVVARTIGNRSEPMTVAGASPGARAVIGHPGWFAGAPTRRSISRNTDWLRRSRHHSQRLSVRVLLEPVPDDPLLPMPGRRDREHPTRWIPESMPMRH